MRNRCVLWVVAGMLLACWQAPGDAQEPAVAPPAETAAEPLREQTIYIPYSKLRGVFEKEGRGVFLPYDKFQELWRQAREGSAAKPEQKPPVDALVTEIDNEAVVEKDAVRVTARITIEVLREGWHEVDLRLGDAAILATRLGEQPARVVSREGGYRLLLEKKDPSPSQYTLTIEYAKAFTKSPGQNSVAFQAPQAPVNRWRIRVPQAGVKVNIHPLIAATEAPLDPAGDSGTERPPGAAPEETVILAFVGAAPEVRIEWTPKAEGASGLAALATVQAEQEVTIDEGIVRTLARLTYDISRAELSQLQIDVPADQKVVNVFDPNVRQWQVEPQDAMQRISVQLFQPARGSQQITIELEKFSEQLAAEPLHVPAIRAVGVGRQQGLVVVRLSSALRADAAERVGLLQLDAAELPASLASQKWDFSYRYASLPFDLSLKLDKVQPRVHAEQLVEAYLEPEQLTLDLLAIHTIERAGVFQLQIEIPAGFEVRNVRGQAAAGAEAAIVESFHTSGADKTLLLVNLASKALGRVGLFVELQKRLDDANLLSPTGTTTEVAIPLPRVALAGIERLTGKLVVYAPESLRASPAKVDGLQVISFAETMAGVESMRGARFATTRPILTYTHTQQPVTLAITAERRKPQITARQMLISSVESGVVKYQARFFFDILYSGVKSVRIDVPQTLAAEIRNETAGIQDQPLQPQPADAAAGYQAWGFTGETELLGRAEILLTWQEKIDELAIGKSTNLTLPVLQPMQVDRAWGQIVIRKAETLDVRESGVPNGLRPIDPQNLMESISLPDAARAFEFHGDWSLQITATRYQHEEVKHTSIERAVLRMVPGRDQSTSVQALYRMRSAQQRLELKLPANIENQDAHRRFDAHPLRINGKPVDLERGDKGEYFVPLANQDPTKPFLLELRYTVPGDYSRLDFPEFPENPAMQKIYLCVYLPQELALIGSRGPWNNDFADQWRQRIRGIYSSLTSDAQLVGWVREGTDCTIDPLSDFQTLGRLYTFSTLRPAAPPDGSLRLSAFNEDALHLLVFLLIAVPGVVLVTQPIGVRIFAVGGLLTALVGVGIFFPTFSMQVFNEVLIAAVGLVLAVWFLMFLFRVARARVATVGNAVRAGIVDTRRPAPLAAAVAGGAAGPIEPRPAASIAQEGDPFRGRIDMESKSERPPGAGDPTGPGAESGSTASAPQDGGSSHA